ncbi:allergen Tha p 1-like [Leptidea sinapis]|uniref:allergen Tha p 1-like n=1 Tax=Leptidea sinapis TaxID=189913 RepID=UPI002132829B|nr:allergen Tha p 1-like [Leptidea sinapis]
MKSLAIVCFVALFAFVSARPELYTDRYDNVDLDEILSNRRLLIPYVKCILDQGKCSPDGKELKSHIKEALEENCGKCTDTQKKGTRRVIGHFINNESDYWNQLKAKYDPKNQYSVKYEQELRTIKAA